MYFHIINHFRPANHGPHLDASVLLSAALAARSPLVASVLVVDGSEKASPMLLEALREVGAGYVHAGRSLTFAEGYNLGVEHSDQPWTILSASDIYPAGEVFEAVHAASRQGSDSSVGCVVPMLTACDLLMQQYHGALPKAPLAIPLMTLNFNAFPTDYLRETGGVPATFSGGYNDVLMARRIRQDRRRIVLAQALCLHLGRLTIDTGETNYRFEVDFETFRRMHPELSLPGGLWGLDLAEFVNAPVPGMLASLIRSLPRRYRERASNGLLRLIIGLAPRFPRLFEQRA